MATTYKSEQLQQFINQIQSGSLSLQQFYQNMANNGYKYANLAEGVVTQNSFSGAVAVNFMQNSAQQQGITLTNATIGAIEQDMAVQWLKAMQVVAGSGTVSADLGYKQTADFHAQTFADFGLAPQTWTLYTPGQLFGAQKSEAMWQNILNSPSAFTYKNILEDMGSIYENSYSDNTRFMAGMWLGNVSGSGTQVSLDAIGDVLLSMREYSDKSVNGFTNYLSDITAGLNNFNNEVIQFGINFDVTNLTEKLTNMLISPDQSQTGNPNFVYLGNAASDAAASQSYYQTIYGNVLNYLKSKVVTGSTGNNITLNTSDSNGNQISNKINLNSDSTENYQQTATNTPTGQTTYETKSYDSTTGTLKQDLLLNLDGTFRLTQYDTDGITKLYQDAFNQAGTVTKESWLTTQDITKFGGVVASALATQAVAQFLFKNNLSASAVAQAFSQVVFNNAKMSADNAQAYAGLSAQQKFMANFGISVANIAASIGGSVAGAKLFQSLGLSPQIGSVVGGVVSQQVVSSVIAQVAGTAGAVTLTEFVAGLKNAGGAAIGSYVGVQLAQLTLGSMNQGATFGGAVGGAVGAVYSAEIATTLSQVLATTINPIIGTIVGTTVGSYLGSLFGSLFGGGASVGPNADASIAYNGAQWYLYASGADNGGSVAIAQQLAQAAIQELNGVAAGIGGHLASLQPGFGVGYFASRGYYSNFQVNGQNNLVYSNSTQTTVDNAVIGAVHRAAASGGMVGGNPFMEYAYAHSTATTVTGLINDLNAAHDYGLYLANPLAFDASLAMSGSQAQLTLWQQEVNQAKALGLDSAPTTADLNNGLLTETGAYIASHLELLNNFKTSGLITGITLTDGAITVNANQASQYNNLISLISNRNSITVTDINANISANIITLNSLTLNNLIASVSITDSPSSDLNNTSLTIAANKIQTVTGYGNTVTASTGDTLIFNSSGIGKNIINAANGDTVYFNGNASTAAGGGVDNINLSNGLLELGKGACLNLRGSGDSVIENANVTLSIFGNNNNIRGADGETIYQDFGGGYTISVGVNSVINLAGNGTTGATGGVDNVNLSNGRVNILPSSSNVTGANVVINGYSNSIAVTSTNNIIINGGGNNLTASGTLNSISISGNGSKGANGGVNKITMSGGSVNILANADALVSGYGDTVIAAAGDTVTFNSTSVGGSNLTIGTGATVNFSGNASLVTNGIIDNVNASGDIVNVATSACLNLRGSNDSVSEGDNATLTVFGSNNGISGGAHETIYQDFGGGYNISVGNNSVVNLAGNGTTGATGGVDNVTLSNGRVNLNASNSTVTGADATISGNNDSVYAVSLDTVSINGASDTVFVSGSGDVVNIAGNGQTLNTAMQDTVNISSGTVNVASYASAIINGNNNTVWTGNNSNANVQGNNNTINIGSNNIITIGNGTGDSLISWGSNNTITGANGDSLIEGGGGNNTYQFARGNGLETITKNASSGLGANGELDFASGIATNQLWFLRNGNNLQIDLMGTHDQVIVANWFGSANSQFKEIKTLDGSMIDTQIASMVSAMATYSGSHSGFDPTSVNQFPADTTLQNALATAWHH